MASRTPINLGGQTFRKKPKDVDKISERVRRLQEKQGVQKPQTPQQIKEIIKNPQEFPPKKEPYEPINQEKSLSPEEKLMKEQESESLRKKQLDEKMAEGRKLREEGYTKGGERYEEAIKNAPPGLSPEQRRAMQAEAYKGIRGSEQGLTRKLLGEQNIHGILPKSGIAKAQRKDLATAANDARASVNRDLTRLDYDLALKKLAQKLGLEQGEAGQEVLNREQALSELDYLDERRRQRELEERAYRQFIRA